MDLSSMLQREDFFKILQLTIPTYYKNAHKKDVVFTYVPTVGCEPLIINRILSFISRPFICKGLYTFLNSEYNIRSSILKYIIGKCAVNIISIFPCIGRVKTAYITEGVLGKNEFINPQNRSIRIFNYDTQTVDCIIKYGFTDKYFQNQLNFRKQTHFDFIPRLIDHGENWFREPILVGNPLARVINEADYLQGLADAFVYVGQIISETKQRTDLIEYSCELELKLLKLIAEAELRKNIKFSYEIRRIIKRSIELIKLSNLDFYTSVSHGDLQTGNIWLDNEKKTWIYDWETVGRRSIWYDVSVLGYSLRRPLGWKELISTNDYSLMLRFDDFRNYSEKEILVIKRIILLEDILFYLEDMLELPEDWGNWIFDGFCERILPLFQSDL